MSDERLLSEALRAHAAGGVSTPRVDTPAAPDGAPASDTGSGGQPAGRRRFRPLGRVRGREQAARDAAESTQPDQDPADRSRGTAVPARPRPDGPTGSRADVPAPRSGGPGLPPPGFARGPVPPAPPTAPVRPGPTSGGFGAVGGPGRGPGPAGRSGAARPAPVGAGTPAGYVPWSTVTVTWWSLVAVLAGAVVGGAIGVLSLLLPA
jgi:hypothetical protein